MVVYPEQITILIMLPIKMVSFNSSPNQLQSKRTSLFKGWRLQVLLPIHTNTKRVLKRVTSRFYPIIQRKHWVIICA